ncbi:hypothetical protein GZ22_18560 (plasmid) [Terribacillus saccharophilus]|uniref:Uncharacterized protein n=1 Tax=Terribacillus saccharophilus TaxID=361277 RepID=A0A075LVD0_9BACI|nr:hypothetical protein [Terribacillus goriensis]AIF68428.1 hypothetical protein GZ22_18560 [Terribacillus goriensis]
MPTYSEKCGCGQPYNVSKDGDYPMKDVLTRKCPSCGTMLSIKASWLDAKWDFDTDFKGSK